jgi:DHA1 family tetracycline resistance protein-like MFS transporter
VDWRRANPLSALKQLSELKGVGPLVVVLACTGLAQFTLYTVWVLYATFKFGWGPTENGWSMFAIGVVAAVVQGGLLGRLLKVWRPPKLALLGLLSSTLAFVAFGLVTEGWMMYVVIVANILGNTVTAVVNSQISGAADHSEQGQTMGAVSGLNSLMAVIAPTIAAPLLGLVAGYPQGDWRIGLPMYFCAALQALALAFAIAHFRTHRQALKPA